jgi:predicted dehydrogenase
LVLGIVVGSGDVDVVYVATTNDRHRLDAAACIDVGVPVLVEKPFAMTTLQAEPVLASARDRGVFVMEAMWMRLQPGFLEVQRRLAAGQLGRPRLMTSHFGMSKEMDPTRRWFSVEQGAGHSWTSASIR